MNDTSQTATFKAEVDEVLSTPSSTLRTYVGTKLLQAEPMTRGEYNLHRDWPYPEGEDQTVVGYRVVYADGYQSWTPAPQFEEAYIELEVAGLAPHQVRVVAEKAELDKKLNSLTAFIASRGEVFLGLGIPEQTRLVMQHTIMAQYSQLLGQRLADFKVQP